MTLACNDANSILVEVVTVDAETRVDKSLVQIWNLKFCHQAKLLLRLCVKDLVKILKLKFQLDLEAEVWSVFCCRYLVEVMKVKLVGDSEARFGQDFEV